MELRHVSMHENYFSKHWDGSCGGKEAGMRERRDCHAYSGMVNKRCRREKGIQKR
jgi:hypothetical protein